VVEIRVLGFCMGACVNGFESWRKRTLVTRKVVLLVV